MSTDSPSPTDTRRMNPSPFVCPRCDYPLIPVHAVEAHKRRIVALTCPEPYCDHMQMIPRGEAERFERRHEATEVERNLRAAN